MDHLFNACPYADEFPLDFHNLFYDNNFNNNAVPYSPSVFLPPTPTCFQYPLLSDVEGTFTFASTAITPTICPSTVDFFASLASSEPTTIDFLNLPFTSAYPLPSLTVPSQAALSSTVTRIPTTVPLHVALSSPTPLVLTGGRKRAPKRPTPPEKKDATYFKKRAKNTEASMKHRREQQAEARKEEQRKGALIERRKVLQLKCDLLQNQVKDLYAQLLARGLT